MEEPFFLGLKKIKLKMYGLVWYSLGIRIKKSISVWYLL